MVNLKNMKPSSRLKLIERHEHIELGNKKPNTKNPDSQSKNFISTQYYTLQSSVNDTTNRGIQNLINKSNGNAKKQTVNKNYCTAISQSFNDITINSAAFESPDLNLDPVNVEINSAGTKKKIDKFKLPGANYIQKYIDQGSNILLEPVYKLIGKPEYKEKNPTDQQENLECYFALHIFRIKIISEESNPIRGAVLKNSHLIIPGFNDFVEEFKRCELSNIDKANWLKRINDGEESLLENLSGENNLDLDQCLTLFEEMRQHVCDNKKPLDFDKEYTNVEQNHGYGFYNYDANKIFDHVDQ